MSIEELVWTTSWFITIPLGLNKNWDFPPFSRSRWSSLLFSSNSFNVEFSNLWLSDTIRKYYATLCGEVYIDDGILFISTSMGNINCRPIPTIFRIISVPLMEALSHTNMVATTTATKFGRWLSLYSLATVNVVSKTRRQRSIDKYLALYLERSCTGIFKLTYTSPMIHLKL